MWWLWAIIALVPVVGLIAYVLLRPSLLRVDRDEQELEIALKQRQLMRYGECATCGYPVEADYVVCPNCHQRLKNVCSHCEKALDPAWTVCPLLRNAGGHPLPQPFSRVTVFTDLMQERPAGRSFVFMPDPARSHHRSSPR